MDAVSLVSSVQSKFLHISAFASSCDFAWVRIVGSPISVGMTASIPYARAKGVFPVGRPGSSSTHFPLACSSLFFKAVIRVLFVASACPLL